MIVICHFVLAVVYLYDGEYHRRHLVNQTSYVCGTLWMVTAVYELMNMPKVQNFIYTVSRVNRLAVSFMEEIQHWDLDTIISLDMLILFPTIFIFVLEWRIRNYPADFLIETNPEIVWDCIGLIMFPVCLLLMACMAGHYVLKSLCIFFTIANVKAIYGIWRQLLIINDDERYLI